MNDAIARFQKLAEEQPDNELARFSLGKALFEAGRFAEAKEQLTAALNQQPDWMAALILLGRCELSMGNKPEAKSILEKARKLAIAQNHVGPREQVEQLLATLGP